MKIECNTGRHRIYKTKICIFRHARLIDNYCIYQTLTYLTFIIDISFCICHTVVQNDIHFYHFFVLLRKILMESCQLKNNLSWKSFSNIENEDNTFILLELELFAIKAYLNTILFHFSAYVFRHVGKLRIENNNTE